MALTEMNYIEGGGISQIIQDATPTSANTTKTYTLEVGKVYLLLIWGSSSVDQSYATYNSASISGANKTIIGNLFGANNKTFGTCFQIIPTQTSVTVSSSSGVYILFEPE